VRPLWLALALGCLIPAAQAAKIELSTVPPREGVEVIIYRDVDLTLVREQRTIRFHQGENEIAFSWADTNIDPTSVRIRIAGDGEGYALTETTYPPEQPNTLVWHITAPADGPAPLEVTYFTSGLTWSAGYTLILNNAETGGTFSADFSIANHSGEAYESARVSLLTGGVRLIEEVVALETEAAEEAPKRVARGAMMEDMAVEAPPPASAAPGMGGGMGGYALGDSMDAVAIAAASASEHERYNLDTDLALLDGWVTRLRFAETDVAEPEVIARFGNSFSGASAQRIIKINNAEEYGLGTAPLPEGPIAVFKRDETGRLVYVGQSQFPYAGVGQEVEFAAGVLQDVVIEAKHTGMLKRDFAFNDTGYVQGKVVENDFTIEIRNRDEIARTFELTIPRPGAPNVVVGAPTAEIEARLIRFEPMVEALTGVFSTEFSFHEYHGTAVNDMPEQGAAPPPPGEGAAAPPATMAPAEEGA
jgi:hypothetical protein